MMKRLVMAAMAVLFMGAQGPISVASFPNISTVQGLGAAIKSYSTIEIQSYSGTTGLGGGKFYWNAASTATVDGCTIFAASGVATGRLIRIYQPPLPLEACGAVGDDSTDNNTAIINALALHTSLIGTTNAIYKIHDVGGNLFTLDFYQTKLDCNGARIDARSMVTNGSALFTVTTTSTDPNLMMGYNAIHPISNCFFTGPEGGTYNVRAIDTSPKIIAGTPWLTGLTFDNNGATGFHDFYRLGSGTVGITINNSRYIGGGIGTGNFLDVVAGTNNGENYSVNGGYAANLAGSCFNDENGGGSNVDIYVRGFSCDGTFYILTGGTTFGSGSSAMTVYYQGHIEGTQNTDYVFNISDGGFIYQGGQWVGSTAPTHTVCNNTAVSSAPGIQLVNVEFNENTTVFQPYDTFWCDGGGNFTSVGASQLGNTQLGLFTQSNNIVVGAEAPDPGSFTIANAVTANALNVPPVTGATGSLKLANSGGNASAYVQIPCLPGDQISASAWVKAPAIAADGSTWALGLAWLGQNNTVVQTNNVSGAANLAAFTKELNLPPQKPAPRGTIACRMTMQLTGGGGAGIVYFGYPQFNKY